MIMASSIAVWQSDREPIGAVLPNWHQLDRVLHYMQLTQAMAAVPQRELGEVVVSLQDQRETVLRALDLLLTGV